MVHGSPEYWEWYGEFLASAHKRSPDPTMTGVDHGRQVIRIREVAKAHGCESSFVDGYASRMWRGYDSP